MCYQYFDDQIQFNELLYTWNHSQPHANQILERVIHPIMMQHTT